MNMPARGRGRGRRQGRGHAGGRSSSRGRAAGRCRLSRGSDLRNDREKKTDNEIKEIDLLNDPQSLFTGTATTEQHLEAQKKDRVRYVAALVVLLRNKVELTQNAIIRALAMAWGRGDQELAEALLSLRSHLGLVEVLKVVTLLDAGRRLRAVEKRLKYLQLSEVKVRHHKLGKLKSDIDNLKINKPPVGSASGAVCKHVSRWVRSFTAEEFEFFAIHFPKDPWKKLADICHLNPEKDFPTAPWFLPYCFETGTPPVDSLVQHCQDLTADNVNQLVQEFNIPFSVLKPFKDKLDVSSKKRIAQYEAKLDTLIWWFEDLVCPEAEAVISSRLDRGEPVTLPTGKLLERLLTMTKLCPNTQFLGQNNKLNENADSLLARLIQATEPRLTKIRLNLESPIVVIGDASGSMEVAIRTSTIIASLLTAVCSARLVFFNTETRDAPVMPKTIHEILHLALTTVASGGTAPAASLYPFYKEKEVVKTFIIVTDEEENESHKGYRFADLYKKYHDEVFPAHLVFVSFLRQQHAEGQMVRDLQKLGFQPKQLSLEGSRPDLTRLEDMFGQLSAATTTSFLHELQETEEFVKLNGVAALFESLKDICLISADA